jgi:ABC-type transport system substrate-binding protein
VIPNTPPLEDIRVRKALAHAIGSVPKIFQGKSQLRRGGIIPRGMPGHSPALGYAHNPDLARRLFDEAGYPDGRGFPSLQAGIGTELGFDTYKEPIEWMAATLGIKVNFKPTTYSYDYAGSLQLNILGWILDFPDPDRIMRFGSFNEILRRSGWNKADYDKLVDQAATTQNRSIRMKLYRRADYILVSEQIVIVPVEYGEIRPIIQISQPWVKEVKNYPIGGWIPYKYLTIDEDERRRSGSG